MSGGQGGDAVVRVSVTHDGLTLALVELAPYPFSSRTIAPGDYRATLRAPSAIAAPSPGRARLPAQ